MKSWPEGWNADTTGTWCSPDDNGMFSARTETGNNGWCLGDQGLNTNLQVTVYNLK